MKALVYTANLRVELQEHPIPSPAEDEALIRVTAAGICGSDVDGFLGRSRKRVPPLVMGHEFAGVLEQDVPAAGLKRGQRVSVLPLKGCGVCGLCASGRTNMCPARVLIGMDVPGAFAGYVVAPVSALYPLPPQVSEVEAVLAEPLANAIHLSRMLPHPLPESAVVLGAGTIGVLVTTVLKRQGLPTIAATDTNPGRLSVAKEAGAAYGLDASGAHLADELRALTGEAPLILDCIGRAETRALAIDLAAPGALLIWIGLHDGDMAGEARDITTKELTVRGSYGYTRRDFEDALALLAEDPEFFRKLVECAPLESGQQVFEKLVRDPGRTLKVAFCP